jgi:RND superfamily putative drug exporter
MNRFFASLSSSVVRYRFLVIAVWIVIAVVSVRSLPSLGSELNNNNTQFLPATAPSQRALNLAAPLSGSSTANSQVLVILSTSKGSLSRADERPIVAMTSALSRLPKVISSNAVKVSPDRSAVVVQVNTSISASDVQDQKSLINAMESTLQKIPRPANLEFHLAGQIATNVANQASSDRAGHRIQSLSFLLIILLLLLIFRAPLAAVVTLIPPGVALIVSMRFIGGLGAHGLKISEITDLLLIVLMLGAGTDYGLFLVFRVRESLSDGLDPKSAVRHALVRVGESISASAGTVIFALLTLLLAGFGIYHDLGVPLALGMVVILLAGLTLLPALLAIFGRALFWPRHPLAGRETRGVWGTVAARLVKRPAVTLGAGVAVFLGLAVAALGYSSGGFGGATSAPRHSDAAIGNALLAKKFPQTSGNPANLILRYKRPVFDSPSELAAATAVLEGSHEFRQLSGPLNPNGTTISPTDYALLHKRLGDPRRLSPVDPAPGRLPQSLYNAYRATALFVDHSGTTVQFEATLRAGDQGSTAAIDATPKVRALLSAAGRRSGAQVTGLAGEAAALYDINNASNHDLITIIPVAILAIALLLALVLRSLVAPLYLILSVALSYFAALGVSTLAFIDIGGAKGLTFILPFLMFVFLLALGEDYNILVMTRIREEAHHRSLREAVVEAIGRTGTTVTSAGLILAGTFGVIAVAGGSGPGSSQVRDIGFGLAIGILMDTFLVRTLLVPSVVSVLGRFNWWPARLSRRARHEGRTEEGLVPAERSLHA